MSEPQQVVTAPVVIVGAGPVGLTLASELHWRGVRTVVVERTDGKPPTPRTNVIAARSMEHFRRLGLAERLRDVGLPDDYPPDLVARARFCAPDLAREPWWSRGTLRAAGHDELVWPTPELPHRANQRYFQPVLLRHLLSQDAVTVMRQSEVVALEARDDGVRVVVSSPHGPATIECTYLVGCDGAHSMVRKAIGTTLYGIPEISRRVSIFLRSEELRRLNTAPAWSYAIYNADVQRGSIFALNGGDEWLLHTQFPAGTDISREEPPALVRELIGRDIAFEVLGVERWIARALVADRFRRGRVFLAGDAAHLWVPSAGFGMNSGIQEAVTLGWMLSAVLEGWGGNDLLDAYEVERRPIGERVARIVAEISSNFTGAPRQALQAALADVEREGPLGDRARAVLHDYAVTYSFPQHSPIGLNFAYSYDGSPVVVPDGTPAPVFRFDQFVPDARPGHRLPHFRREGGRPVFDVLGKDFSLLCLRGADPSEAARLAGAARDRRMPLAVVDLPEREAADLYHAPFVLVRPDQHVAWRGDGLPGDPGILLDQVRGAVSGRRGHGATMDVRPPRTLPVDG